MKHACVNNLCTHSDMRQMRQQALEGLYRRVTDRDRRSGEDARVSRQWL